MKKIQLKIPMNYSVFNLIGLIIHKLKDNGHTEELHEFISHIQNSIYTINTDVVKKIAAKYIDFC